MKLLKKILIFACAVAVLAVTNVTAMKRLRDGVSSLDQQQNKKLCSNNRQGVFRQGPQYNRMPLVKSLGNNLYKIGRAQFIQENDGQFFHHTKKHNPAEGKNLTALRAYVIAIARRDNALIEENKECNGKIECPNQRKEKGLVPFLVIANPSNQGHIKTIAMPNFMNILMPKIEKKNAISAYGTQKCSRLVYLQAMQAKSLHDCFFGKESELFMSVVYKYLKEVLSKFKVSLEQLNATLVLPGAPGEEPSVIMLATNNDENSVEISEDDVTDYYFFPSTPGQKFPTLPTVLVLEQPASADDQDCLITGPIHERTHGEDPFLLNNPDILSNVLHENLKKCDSASANDQVDLAWQSAQVNQVQVQSPQVKPDVATIPNITVNEPVQAVRKSPDVAPGLMRIPPVIPAQVSPVKAGSIFTRLTRQCCAAGFGDLDDDLLKPIPSEDLILDGAGKPVDPRDEEAVEELKNPDAGCCIQ